jgi:hypothetical protein
MSDQRITSKNIQENAPLQGGLQPTMNKHLMCKAQHECNNKLCTCEGEARRTPSVVARQHPLDWHQAPRARRAPQYTAPLTRETTLKAR